LVTRQAGTENKTKHMKFTNKQEYLTYTFNWKLQYKQLSQTIRNLKFMAKEESRACNKARQMLPSEGVVGSWYSKYFSTIAELLAANEQYQTVKTQTNEKSYNINKLKQKATAMLEERAASKVEAQRLYLEAKQALVAA
jgi:uncharacterized membrane protein